MVSQKSQIFFNIQIAINDEWVNSSRIPIRTLTFCSLHYFLDRSFLHKRLFSKFLLTIFIDCCWWTIYRWFFCDLSCRKVSSFCNTEESIKFCISLVFTIDCLMCVFLYSWMHSVFFSPLLDSLRQRRLTNPSL